MDEKKRSIPWLKELEERVRETADRLRETREENTTLKSRIAELEKQLASAPGSEEKEAWVLEKSEIRSRVESLAEHLEELLKES